ncbi:MAG: DUF4838 domain-containing protein [Planctomycetes bacterium]|nr:DUF4838 domain-containing protein [Planctomycetota bacterium]
MMRRCAIVSSVCTLLAAICAAAEDPPAIRIAAPRGAFPSVAAAGRGECEVDWWDGDERDDTVVTCAFAATEIRRCLLAMAGRDGESEAYPLLDDGSDPGGDLILVGGPRQNRLTGRLIPDLAAPDPANPEAFAIASRRIGPRRLLVLGGGGRAGTLYAAYEFLERLGVRWFAPGEIHEEVPRRIIRTLPELSVSGAPAFLTRGFWAWEDRGDEPFFLWLARNKMNFWTIAESEPEVALLKKLGFQLTCGQHEHIALFLNPASPFPYAAGAGGRPAEPYTPSPQFRGDANGDGIISYFEAHPEWYGLQGGKRSADVRGGFGDNFCTSNPDAVSEFFKNLVQELVDGAWREADSVNFWMLDVGRWCTCEACRALGTPTDRNLLLVHRLRQEIARALREGRLHRDVKVFFLAYADVVEPPTRPLPEDFDREGAIATFFPILRCYVHTFEDPTCREFNERYRRHYRGWALDPERFWRDPLAIGEYYNVSGYKNLPALYRRTQAADIPYFQRTGVRHMHYMHASIANWGPKALTNWQMARLLWDPASNPEALYADYLRGRYGSASEAMRAFYDSLERALSNITCLKYNLVLQLDRDAADPFDTDHLRYDETTATEQSGPSLVAMREGLAKARGILDEVLLGDLPPRVAARILEDEGMLRYAEDTVAFIFRVARGQMLLHRGLEARARREIEIAARHAVDLKATTEATRYASTHANAKDGYEASRAGRAFERLAKRLGVPFPPAPPPPPAAAGP